MPLGEIASPFIKSLKVEEVTMRDVNLFLTLAKTGRLGSKYVQSSLNFLSDVCRNNVAMSRTAAVPLLVMLGVHGELKGTQIWAAR